MKALDELKDKKESLDSGAALALLKKTGKQKESDQKQKSSSEFRIPTKIDKYFKEITRSVMREPNKELREQLNELHIRLRNLLLPMEDEALEWLLAGAPLDRGDFRDVAHFREFLSKDPAQISSSLLVTRLQLIICCSTYRVIPSRWSLSPQPDTPDQKQLHQALCQLMEGHIMPSTETIYPDSAYCYINPKLNLESKSGYISDTSDIEGEIEKPKPRLNTNFKKNMRLGDSEILSWLGEARENNILVRAGISNSSPKLLAFIIGLLNSGKKNTWIDNQNNLMSLAAILLITTFFRQEFHSPAETYAGIKYYLDEAKKKTDTSVQPRPIRPKEAFKKTLELMATTASDEPKEGETLSLKQSIETSIPTIMGMVGSSCAVVESATLEKELKKQKEAINVIAAKVQALGLSEEKTISLPQVDQQLKQVSSLALTLTKIEEDLRNLKYLISLDIAEGDPITKNEESVQNLQAEQKKINDLLNHQREQLLDKGVDAAELELEQLKSNLEEKLSLDLDEAKIISLEDFKALQTKSGTISSELEYTSDRLSKLATITHKRWSPEKQGKIVTELKAQCDKLSDDHIAKRQDLENIQVCLFELEKNDRLLLEIKAQLTTPRPSKLGPHLDEKIAERETVSYDKIHKEMVALQGNISILESMSQFKTVPFLRDRWNQLKAFNEEINCFVTGFKQFQTEIQGYLKCIQESPDTLFAASPLVKKELLGDEKGNPYSADSFVTKPITLVELRTIFECIYAFLSSESHNLQQLKPGYALMLSAKEAEFKTPEQEKTFSLPYDCAILYQPIPGSNKSPYHLIIEPAPIMLKAGGEKRVTKSFSTNNNQIIPIAISEPKDREDIHRTEHAAQLGNRLKQQGVPVILSALGVKPEFLDKADSFQSSSSTSLASSSTTEFDHKKDNKAAEDKRRRIYSPLARSEYKLKNGGAIIIHSLRELIEHIKKGNIKLTESQLITLTEELLNAVKRMHNATPPTVHRDINPNNILLRDGHVQLCDFGCSSDQVEQSAREIGIGTKAYFSPDHYLLIWKNHKPPRSFTECFSDAKHDGPGFKIAQQLAKTGTDLEMKTLNPFAEDCWSVGITLQKLYDACENSQNKQGQYPSTHLEKLTRTITSNLTNQDSEKRVEGLNYSLAAIDHYKIVRPAALASTELKDAKVSLPERKKITTQNLKQLGITSEQKSSSPASGAAVDAKGAPAPTTTTTPDFQQIVQAAGKRMQKSRSLSELFKIRSLLIISLPEKDRNRLNAFILTDLILGIKNQYFKTKLGYTPRHVHEMQSELRKLKNIENKKEPAIGQESSTKPTTVVDLIKSEAGWSTLVNAARKAINTRPWCGLFKKPFLRDPKTHSLEFFPNPI